MAARESLGVRCMRALSSSIVDGISRAGSPWTQSAGTTPRASRHTSPCPVPAPGPGLPGPSYATPRTRDKTHDLLQVDAAGVGVGGDGRVAEGSGTGPGTGCGCAPEMGPQLEPHAVLHNYLKSLETREFGVVPWKLKRQMLARAKALAESQAQAQALAEAQLAGAGADGEKPDTDLSEDMAELQSLLLRRRRSTPSMLADRRPRSQQALRNLVTPLGIADEATLTALFGNGSATSQNQGRNANSNANARGSSVAAAGGQKQQHKQRQTASQQESALNTTRSSVTTNPRSRPGSTRGPLNPNAQQRGTANTTPMGLRPTSRAFKSSTTTANSTPDPSSSAYSYSETQALLEEHRRIARLRASLNVPLRGKEEEDEEDEPLPLPLVLPLPKVAVKDDFGFGSGSGPGSGSGSGSGSSTSNMRSRSGSGISDAAVPKSIEVPGEQQPQQQNRAPGAEAKTPATGKSEGQQPPSQKFGLSISVAEFSRKVEDNEGMDISTTAKETPSQESGSGAAGRESAATLSSGGDANAKGKRSFGLTIAMPDISRKVIDNEGMGISTYEDDTLNLDKQKEAIKARIAATTAALANLSLDIDQQTPGPGGESTTGSQTPAQGYRESFSERPTDGRRRRKRRLKVCERMHRSSIQNTVHVV